MCAPPTGAWSPARRWKARCARPATRRKALADARKAEAEQLRSPLEPLRYQRQLLENVRLLEAIQEELSASRIELASLMGLPPGMDTQNLRGGARFQPRPQWLEQPVEDLEARALMLNPDLRESLYNARIAQEETKRVLLRMFPGLSFNYSLNKSNDSYLINDHWREAGVQVSFNLLSLLSAPQQWKLAKDGVSLADQKRLATQMAVLAAAHRPPAIRQRDEPIPARRRDRRRGPAHRPPCRQSGTGAEAGRSGTGLATGRRHPVVAAPLPGLSNMQAAARLQATLGLEPTIDGSDAMPLPELTAAVARGLSQWESGKLP